MGYILFFYNEVISFFMCIMYECICICVCLFFVFFLIYTEPKIKIQCRGVLLLLHIVGQGPAVLVAGAGRVGYIFCFI